MPSLIPGYEYDIFISYRQKDNKGEQWVTEFVKALKTELNSTFKDEVSVFFDENQFDGLLESHDVDKSLERKLRCLIFIPILSQTYCDPKSFAWLHEFCAFNRAARYDQFGRDIVLGNGNVASRIISIRIHDLDTEDKSLVENELGGILRPIDFIYKATGVNRPLTPKDDELKDNANHTIYRNQINKVANAAKEIISGLKNQRPDGAASKPRSSDVLEGRKHLKVKWIVSFFVLALAIAGYFVFPIVFKTRTEPADKSIAVLPFRNDSEEKETEHFSNGVMESILNHLAKISELRVLGRTSVEQFRDSPASVSEINDKLNVSYLLEGSVQKFGDKVVVNVQLLETKTGGHVWSEAYEYEYKSQFEIMKDIAREVAKKIRVSITPEEEKRIEQVPTNNLTAYDFYVRARDEQNFFAFKYDQTALDRAKALYKRALEIDSTYAQAYAGLAMVYWELHSRDTSLFEEDYMDSTYYLATKALSFNDQVEEAYFARATYFRWSKGDISKAIEEFDKAVKINPSYGSVYHALGGVYSTEGDLVKSFENFHKAARVDRGKELPSTFRGLASAYYNIGQTTQGERYLKEALKLDNDTSAFRGALTIGCSENFDTLNATLVSLKKPKIDTSNYVALADDFARKKQYEEAAKFDKKYLDQLRAKGLVPEGGELARAGYVLYKLGRKKEGDYFLDQEIKQNLATLRLKRVWVFAAQFDLAKSYACRGDKEKAYEHLRVLGKNKTHFKWLFSSFKTEPLFENIRGEPEFDRIVGDMELKYEKEKSRTLNWLRAQGYM